MAGCYLINFSAPSMLAEIPSCRIYVIKYERRFTASENEILLVILPTTPTIIIIFIIAPSTLEKSSSI